MPSVQPQTSAVIPQWEQELWQNKVLCGFKKLEGTVLTATTFPTDGSLSFEQTPVTTREGQQQPNKLQNKDLQ